MSTGEEITDCKQVLRQQIRARLRESFLKAICELTGKPCSVLSYEKASLNAIFTGWNPDGSAVLVKDLETPCKYTMKAALLRVPDVLAIKFDSPVLLP